MRARNKADEYLDNQAFIEAVSPGDIVTITDKYDMKTIAELRRKKVKLVYSDSNMQLYEIQFVPIKKN